MILKIKNNKGKSAKPTTKIQINELEMWELDNSKPSYE